MKNILIYSILAIIAMSIILVSCKKEEEKGSISGIVTNSVSNEPLEGVNVTTQGNSATTGTDGKFTFSDLSLGSYTIQYVKEGYETTTKNVTVSANTTAKADAALTSIVPTLQLSTTSLDFEGTLTTLPVDITNIGQGELEWSVSENTEWISVNPTSGTTTTEATPINITVNRDGLSQGTHTQTVSVTSNGGSKTITVNLTVLGPTLAVNPVSLDFGNVENEKSLHLSNSGIGTVTYTATANESWLSVSSANGSITTQTTTITAIVNRGALSPGSYSGSIVFNTNSNTVTVPVNMTIIAPAPPTVNCATATGITWSEAEVAGNIIDMGSSAASQHGHCWSTSPNPTINNNKSMLGSTSATGSFTSTVNGLSASTLYYVRAYATNAEGTAYSNQISFNTLAPPTLAVVSTGSAISFTHNTINMNGSISNLGDGYVTQHGFCYSTSSNPTIANSKIELGSTTSTGAFSGAITGLNEQTTYHIRAYATNSLGTAYGADVSVTTDVAPPVVTNGLVAYYKFDDGTAADWTGNYNGINHGVEFSNDIPNNNGFSASFNGASYISIVSAIIPPASNWSLNIWFKTANSNQALFTTSVSYCKIYINQNSKLYQFVSSGNYWESTNSISNNLDNQWHMLTITFDGSSAKYYIDAVLNEIKNSTSFKWQSHNSTYIGDDTADTTLNNMPAFNGKMDNIRTYNRALSQTEIYEIYSAQQ